MHKYFHDFRAPVENVTIEIAITIKNSWSLKLHQETCVISLCLLNQHWTGGLLAIIQPTKAV